jgi:hypothetical protein
MYCTLHTTCAVLPYLLQYIWHVLHITYFCRVPFFSSAIHTHCMYCTLQIFVHYHSYLLKYICYVLYITFTHCMYCTLKIPLQYHFYLIIYIWYALLYPYFTYVCSTILIICNKSFSYVWNGRPA